MKPLFKPLSLLAILIVLCAQLMVPCQAAPQAATSLQAAPAAVPGAVTPDEFFLTAFDYVKGTFLYEDRLKNFDAWKTKHYGKLKTMPEAERAINDMLDSLNDPYTFYRNANSTKAYATRIDAKNVVSGKMLPGKVAYIRITTFSSKHVSSELETLLKQLKDAQKYIIDLRDNGGGFIYQAHEVFSLLVDKGKFTTLKGRYLGNAYKEEYELTDKELVTTEQGAITRSPRKGNLTGNKPMIVLVNSNSASASEMVAGALRDIGRAKVVGNVTFGKGIAQVTFALPTGTSLRVTYAHYYLPGGDCIQGKGITPDHVVDIDRTGDSQLEKARELLN